MDKNMKVLIVVGAAGVGIYILYKGGYLAQWFPQLFPAATPTSTTPVTSPGAPPITTTPTNNPPASGLNTPMCSDAIPSCPNYATGKGFTQAPILGVDANGCTI